jgi:hypothetical protein
MTTPEAIVTAATGASTLQDARSLQEMLGNALGAREYRPIADTWNNHGLMGAPGSYDYKLIELVTNMQDAVLERLARRRYGVDGEIPYLTPHEAADDLLAGMTEAEIAANASVTLRESDPPAIRTKRLTAVFRDHGCGLTPDQIPRTIFRLGGSHKEDALYLQGAFGMGGAMTYRNAAAVVLVSRRAPELLEEGEEDLISVAVVEWRDNTKGRTAVYLVDEHWDEPGDQASPWSCPASQVPDFEPGTHLALISYRADGIQRKTERDERSFNSVADTRLFDPVMPILFTNEMDRGRRTTLRGLEGRLERTSASAFPTNTQVLPFRSGSDTYHLPIRYVLFDKRRTGGGIDKFVAAGHAVIFTSNGQVHHHWTPTTFRQKTKFNKIYDRVLIIVETDELPILLRTSLFTADRNDLVRTDDAIRLEEAVASLLTSWDELEEENSALVRDALRAGGEQLTAELGRKIGIAFKATGFSSTSTGGTGGGSGAGGGRSGGGKPGRGRVIDLHMDPTSIEGPHEIQVEPGTTRSVSFIVDVVDEFWPSRGELVVTTDHPDVGARDITVGRGRKGRVRTLVTFPDNATLGTYALTVSLAHWHRSSGGLGPELTWTTKVEVIPQIEGRGSGSGRRETGKDGGTAGVGSGTNVALRWLDHDKVDSWERVTVGDVEDVAAADLAATLDDYADLASLGDTPIPTIQLNEEYPPFKHYLEGRSQSLAELERPREQYALGVGLALLVLRQAAQQADKAGEGYPEHLFGDAARAAARGVLAVMPQFDQMIRQAGATNDDGDD